MSLVKFVKGDTTSNSSTYTRQGTGNIEFDSTTKKIYLDGVNYTGEVEDELLENSNNPVSSSALYEVITQNELTTAAALTEHEDAISDINTALNNKQDTLTFDSTPTANSTNPVTSGGIKTYVDTAINNLPEPMVFKGSLGTGGTITALPTNGSANVGDTYKVITAGTYANKAADEGDTFICLTKTSNSNTWELIPSGDEPSGTVTSVGMTVPTGLSVSGSPITTSGTLAVTFARGYSIPTTSNQTKWDEKQDALTFDTTPTANSTNPVTSGGIKTYIDNNSPLKVTITYSQIAGAATYLSDKTYSAIQTAITNGRVVKLYYNNKEFDLKSIDSNEVIFERNENDNTYTRIKITNVEYVQLTTGSTLVSGTNIKTINNTSLLGSGDIAVQTPLVSGTDIKTINDQSLLGSGNLDLNPLIFIYFWTDDRPSTPSSGQYWYSPRLNELQVYDGSTWTSVTLSLQKLYIRLATNEIYRHDGREMIRMTINPTSLVTT